MAGDKQQSGRMAGRPAGSPQGAEGRVADAAKDNWVDRFAPLAARPYLRLMRADRPIGFWLLFWPCSWSLTLASMERGDPWLNWCAAPERHVCYLWYLALFLVGAVVMRGAGCVWNDITDRHIDQKVARTRSRPIPSGQVSVRQAVLFMGVLCLAGLLVLVQFNRFTILLGLSSLLIVAVYPFMKRWTNWPQLVLGLAFGWGALMGWAARMENLELSLLLYGATICWIIGYDTIYAHQDREDDALIGMKSTALRFGERTKGWLAVFFGLTMVLLLLAVGIVALEIPSLARLAVMMLGMGFAAGLLIWQVVTLDIHDADNCLDRFRHAHLFGAAVFLTLLVMWAV